MTIGNEAVSFEKLKDNAWIGQIEQKDAWLWVDTMLLLILGGA